MTRPQRPRTAPTGTVASADKATGVRTPRFDAGGRSGRIPRKFFNQPCEVNGIRFDSKAEAARYTGLYVAAQMGEIRDLEVHPRFPLVVHGEDCGAYIADFAYVVVATGERVVEDVKSPATRKLATYRLKVRMVWALYGLRVREVT
jgi:hypothetical protein